MAKNSNRFYGTGRRKSSIARVYLVPGTGKVTINKKDMDEYFGLDTLKLIVIFLLEMSLHNHPEHSFSQNHPQYHNMSVPSPSKVFDTYPISLLSNSLYSSASDYSVVVKYFH